MEDPINYPPSHSSANSCYVLIRDNALGRLRRQFSSWADMMKYVDLQPLGWWWVQVKDDIAVAGGEFSPR